MDGAAGPASPSHPAPTPTGVSRVRHPEACAPAAAG